MDHANANVNACFSFSDRLGRVRARDDNKPRCRPRALVHGRCVTDAAPPFVFGLQTVDCHAEEVCPERLGKSGVDHEGVRGVEGIVLAVPCDEVCRDSRPVSISASQAGP